MKKEEDEFISYMKERKKSDWTDEEKVRITKITRQRMINRRRQRRRGFIDTRRGYIKLGSGQTTRLMLGISIGEWGEYLFKEIKKRYPDDTNDSLLHLLCNTDVQIDEINSCHASTLDIKSQLVLWNWRNSQLLFATDNYKKSANTMSDVT